ncbi:starch-binding protein [Bacteroidales bacterium]|nr:starch-binding protein [Bacteroidales bacterium]
MKLIKNIFIALCVFSMATSCDYLNVDGYFDETFKLDSTFSNMQNIEKYMWGTSASFPDEGAVLGSNFTPGVFASDEGFTMFGYGEFFGMSFINGQVTPDNLYGMDNWYSMYKVVRKTNNILSRMHEANDMTTLGSYPILGYTHFIRAYAYYIILMDFGPLVLLGDDVLETNMEPEYYDRSRSTYHESVDYICQELETAAKYLPEEVAVNQFGRPTRGAALGLIARLRLQQASPLYNGGQAARTYFGNWTRKEDGVHYVSQVYDEKLWAQAAVAAKKVIDMGKYSLHTQPKVEGETPNLPATVSNANFPEGAGNIDPFRSYSEMFTGETLAPRNREFVWGRYSGSTRDYTQHSFPVINMGGWNGCAVTQKVIDTYYMADGKTIGNASQEYPYSEEGTINSPKSFSGYQLRGTVNNMYGNREMRFYASIGFSECLWTASSTSESNRKNIVATYYVDGNAGKQQTDGNINNHTATGYVIKKYIHPDDAWAGNGAQITSKPYGIIRYAEILLSYAEALNNLKTSHSITDSNGYMVQVSRNPEEIKRYFNQVRYRAGLPGLSDAEVGSESTMQTLIEKERMLEFLFENRRYYDVRRWGIYEDSENEPFVGMNVDASKDLYYVRTPINQARARTRIVNRKMIFLPIHRSEIRKVPLLDQNPGWSN